MKNHHNILWLLFLVNTCVTYADKCGCKTLRPCYKAMLKNLQDKDEEACIEDASIGASTFMVFFEALKLFCGSIVQVTDSKMTYEGRHLYEVVIHNNNKKQRKNDEDVPVIMVEAGQDAGVDPVDLALYLIEQLLACEEQDKMITKVRWVILPCSNPDGLEYTRFDRPHWNKNTKRSEDGLSYGVDITRNFDVQWGACQIIPNSFSSAYPGEKAASENETIFVQNVLQKYKTALKAYLSIRRDGHAIMYPYAYKKASPLIETRTAKVAGSIARRVNDRGGGRVQVFENDTIYQVNGGPRCGHSVDYAFALGVPFAYEMRVYHKSDLSIISKFQPAPSLHDTNLRNSYYCGIKELYNNVVADIKNKTRF